MLLHVIHLLLTLEEITKKDHLRGPFTIYKHKHTKDHLKRAFTNINMIDAKLLKYFSYIVVF